MILQTGTEELAHIEMLTTAVALNLRGAADAVQEGVGARNPVTAAILGGMDPRHALSSGLYALPTNANGVPFDTSHVYASGNIAADMYTNVAAEATGRVLATRLHALTDDPGMKDMLSFLIAHDTMHQQQWLAVIEDLGGATANLPIPNSFPQQEEKQEFSYAFLAPVTEDGPVPAEGRWSSGPSIDGKGEFSIQVARPLGDEPVLPAPIPEGFAQTSQMTGAPADLDRRAPPRGPRRRARPTAAGVVSVMSSGKVAVKAVKRGASSKPSTVQKLGVLGAGLASELVRQSQ